MARRSRLLATVAFPFVSLSLLVSPASAAGMRLDVAGVVSSDVVTVQSEEEQPVRRKPKREQQAEEGQQAAPEEQQGGQSREERKKQRQQAQQQGEQAAPEGEQQGQSREERKKAREERLKKQQEQQQAEQPAVAPDGEQQQGQSREERRKAREERLKKQQEQQQAEQPAVAPDGEQQGQTREERRKAREERLKQQQLQEQQQTEGQQVEQQPGEKAAKDKPEVRERKRRNADNPAATDETIVLPVDNGAAVLDSDKDADRAGSKMTREERRKLRAERRNVRVPTSDADAQIDSEGRVRPPVRIERVTREQGRALRERPRYEVPEGIDVRDRRDNRVVINIDNRTIVRNDDSYRFRRQGERVTYEGLSNGRVREVVVKPNGDRVITVRNRWGDVIRRSRVDAREREYVLFYSPELYRDPDLRYEYRDPGLSLPPMRLAIPVRDYIIDTSSEPDRDYYEFLDQPPVEPVERVYTLDEVKYSARIRDKVRRIDLDTITFSTGSAEIPMSQAQTLRKVADAINKALDSEPAETFLIEGHTDAVGSDESNLVLSDERAESVANVLTDVYGIPPENLTTQGYGEQFLKVDTGGPEQQNRRVTIRRVTALVRPAEVAQE